MIVAREKRKENIVEFILYMWQVEDLLRACNLDFNLIIRNIVSKYDQPPEVLKEIEIWYQTHLEMMVQEGKQNAGHLAYLETLVNDLNELHLALLNSPKDEAYLKLYTIARSAIADLGKKMAAGISDIEISLNGLYGFLLLKLQKKEISKETDREIHNLSNMLSYLSGRFKSIENGTVEGEMRGDMPAPGKISAKT